MLISDTLSRAPIAGKSDSIEEIAAVVDDENQMADLRLVASERTIKEIRDAAKADEQYQSADSHRLAWVTNTRS